MSVTAESVSSRPPLVGGRWGERLLGWMAIVLVAVVWASAMLFGLYILAFYAAAATDGTMERWNEVLPRLYETQTPVATFGIGLHFATGGIILVLGPIQLIRAVRRRFTALHRWIGRLYVTAGLLAGLGGLAFIAVKGTIGGWPMNIGFALYGMLMVVAAVQAYRHAAARRIEAHRAWAIRLFALAIGSWLYRMYYGFWLLFTGGLGHGQYFDGWFDALMAFFFYLPNLAVAELFIRARARPSSTPLQLAGSVVLLAACGLIGVGTYYFTIYYWAPPILVRLGL